MLKQESSSSDNNQKLEVLLKEYDAMRNEVLTRLQLQTQLTSVSSIIIAALVGAIPFLLSLDAQRNLLNIPPLYFVTVFLLIAALFIALLWVFLEYDTELAYIGQYVQVLRKRALELIVGNVDSEEPILSWDFYRVEKLHKRKISGKWSIKLFQSPPMEVALSISRYALTGIPAVLAMGAAIFG